MDEGQSRDGLKDTAQARQRNRQQKTTDAADQYREQQRQKRMHPLVFDQNPNCIRPDTGKPCRADGKNPGTQHHLLAIGKPDCQQKVVEQGLIGINQVHHRRATPTCTPSLPNSPLGFTRSTTNNKP